MTARTVTQEFKFIKEGQEVERHFQLQCAS